MSVLPPLTANLAYDASLFRGAVEAAGEAVLITSAKLDRPGPIILYANPAFARMSGYGVDEVLGRSPRILQGPETDRAVLERMRRELDETGTFKGEAVNYRKDGGEYLIAWVVTAVRDEEGRIMHWVSVQRDVTEQRRAEQRERMLAAELQHRVRNTLGVIRSVVRRSAEASPSLEDYATHLEGRLEAFSRVQATVTRDPMRGIDLEYLVAEELRSAGGRESDTVTIQGPQVSMSPKAAMTVGLAIHELATNALKYGALASSRGEIKVRWSVEAQDGEPTLDFRWIEQGMQLTEQPARKGFGTTILTNTLGYELKAKADLRFTPTGMTYRMTVPLEQLELSKNMDIFALSEPARSALAGKA